MQMFSVKEAVDFIRNMPQGKRNWQLPGDNGRYKPEELEPLLGYDQWAVWLALVEWFWMVVIGERMSQQERRLLTQKRLFKVLDKMTTTEQDRIEKGKPKKKGSPKEKPLGHDILALRQMMAKELPTSLLRYLHLSATSYDIICTAYALQAKTVFEKVYWPTMKEVDDIWRKRIDEFSEIIQAGRTHLQTALPVTVGFWLAQLHSRFIKCALELKRANDNLESKFSGAVGTSASQRALFGTSYEKTLMDILGLKKACVSTQIVPPESLSRFYFEMVLFSGALANLGDDVRFLQASEVGEVMSISSTSSAMPHKVGNPIVAEQAAGMHSNILGDFLKVLLTLVSNLQRDLRGSSVMRMQPAVIVDTFIQLKGVGRLLRSLKVNEARCRQNFDREARLVVAELLHLALQMEGVTESHDLVNKVIVPGAALSKNNLAEEMNGYLTREGKGSHLYSSWEKVPPAICRIFVYPDEYLGYAVEIAKEEADNCLTG